jgi:hypothetical protein
MHLAVENENEHDVMPGDATIILPRHDAWVIGDEPAVFISFEKENKSYDELKLFSYYY